MDSIGVAVAGTGFIGPVHVEALRRAGINVVGILGSTPQKSRAAAESLKLAAAYAAFDELLNDERVQAVHITVPNRFHFKMASQALRAGKHIVCEKPLAMDSRESGELVQLAAQSGLAAAVAYNIRYYPLCLEARERIGRGAAGEVRERSGIRENSSGHVLHVQGSYVQDWLLHKTDFNWRVLAAEGGKLRALADIGTHWLDLVQFITGLRIVAVCTDLATVHSTRHAPRGSVQTFSGKDGDKTASQTSDADTVLIDTEDAGGVLLEFENGARGTLWVSQVTAGRKNCLRFEIACDKESLAWNSERPNELWLGKRDEPNQMLLRDPALLSPAARAACSYPGGHNEGFPDTFKQLFRAFYGYIAAGDMSAPPPFPTFADGHREILLCEAIMKSHQERRWIYIVENS
ncbi:MAG TPA: Gfo/Idh/MocA family oxidoreductase [Planctomycetaceae bacterium]|jgi:predicted dehydrogenase